MGHPLRRRSMQLPHVSKTGPAFSAVAKDIGVTNVLVNCDHASSQGNHASSQSKPAFSQGARDHVLFVQNVVRGFIGREIVGPNFIKMVHP